MPLRPEELDYLAELLAKAYLRGNQLEKEVLRDLIRILHEIDVLRLPAEKQKQVAGSIARAIDVCRKDGESSIEPMTAAVLKVFESLNCQQGEWNQHKGPLSRIVSQHRHDVLQKQLHSYPTSVDDGTDYE